jgi:exo-beta-1,3-glucanase (GH17 family)
MKKLSVPICFLIVTLFFFSASAKAQEGKVKIYPAPASIASSPDYAVSVNGQQAFVYNPKVKTGRERTGC